jgi:MazG family protein
MSVAQAVEIEGQTREARALAALLGVMAKLRDPVDGCPWDLEQSFATIAPYTIEEAYEVAEAIQRHGEGLPGALGELKEELGDLLFQVVFHARMAEERGAFNFADVAEAITAKMLARHPHVFGAAEARNAEEQTRHWEALKAEERAAKQPNAGVLDDVPQALPALMRAEKLTKRAGRIGFDWPAPEPVFDKLEEELEELREAMGQKDQAAIAEEMGDVLFVVANLARKLNVDPEEALRQANAKFTRRFRHMEGLMRAEGKSGLQPLDYLDGLWNAAKADERK